MSLTRALFNAFAIKLILRIYPLPITIIWESIENIKTLMLIWNIVIFSPEDGGFTGEYMRHCLFFIILTFFIVSVGSQTGEARAVREVDKAGIYDPINEKQDEENEENMEDRKKAGYF